MQTYARQPMNFIELENYHFLPHEQNNISEEFRHLNHLELCRLVENPKT